MLPTRQGSFQLFRLAGVNVYLHWSWFLIAAYEMSSRSRAYSSIMWNLFEYLSLFGIVLLHEFGHALACRQVGGQADQIVLWPLGGVAYVAPPQRPGAMLWSIAAGPLVNVILAPVFLLALAASEAMGWPRSMPDTYGLLRMVNYINLALLVFNLLPIYPLDGGQIVRSLLWFVLGRARSLLVASTIGFIGVAALIGLAFFYRSFWIGIMAVFILLNCWRGLMQARALARLEALPHRMGLACPGCGKAPPTGEFWFCGRCRKPFDLFGTAGSCPHCGAMYNTGACVECGRSHPLSQWFTPPPVLPR